MVFIIWYEEQVLNLVPKNGIIFGLDELFLLVFLLSVFLFMISGVCQFFISGTPVWTAWVAIPCLIEHSLTSPQEKPPVLPRWRAKNVMQG